MLTVFYSAHVYLVSWCPFGTFRWAPNMVPLRVPTGSSHVQPCRPHSQAVELPLNWPDAKIAFCISCGIDLEGTRNREQTFSGWINVPKGEIFGRTIYEQIRNMIHNMIKSLQLRSMLSTHDLQSFGGGRGQKKTSRNQKTRTLGHRFL